MNIVYVCVGMKVYFDVHELPPLYLVLFTEKRT